MPKLSTANHRASLLGVMINIWIVGVIALVVVGQVTSWGAPVGYRLSRAASGLGVFLTLLACRVLLARGKTELTACLMLLGLGTGATVTLAVFLGTVRAPLASAYLLIVFMAGLLFAARGLIFTTLLCITAVSGLIAAEHSNWLPIFQIPIGIAQWVTFLILLSLAAILVHMSERARKRALARARDEIELRRSAEEQLRNANDGLESRVVARTADALASEMRFRALAELSADWYWEQDEQLRFVETDGVLRAVGGMDPGLIFGACLWDLPDTQPQNRDWAAHRMALEAREKFRDLLLRRVMADGTVQYLSMSGMPMFDEKGRFKGYRGVAKDVTETQRTATALTERGRELALVLDAVPAMIAYTDATEKIRYHNHAYGRHYSAPPAGLSGRQLREVLDADSYEALRPHLLKVLAGEHVSFERRSKRALPLETNLAIQLTPHVGTDNQILGYYAVLVDVTQLTRLDRMKGEFISTVSHELRTPLTGVKGALDLLAGPLAGQLSEQALLLTKMALASSERLARMINDLLDIERIESGGLAVHASVMDMVLQAERALNLNQMYAAQQGVRLELKVPHGAAFAVGDVDRLQQVFANLISNAVKFSRPGDVVEIEVRPMGEKVQVFVRDHGPGVPEHFRRRLFEKFSQADRATERTHQGSGLGLAISRALIERQGGSIGHENVQDGGALFWFMLDSHG
jgi:PAS domain S-box-containing protein